MLPQCLIQGVVWGEGGLVSSASSHWCGSGPGWLQDGGGQGQPSLVSLAESVWQLIRYPDGNREEDPEDVTCARPSYSLESAWLQMVTIDRKRNFSYVEDKLMPNS